MTVRVRDVAIRPDRYRAGSVRSGDGFVVAADGQPRWGRFGAAGVLVAMTIACPLSGHHAGIGAWWCFELAGSLALVAASEAALRA